MKLEVAADDSLPGTVRAWVVFSNLIDRIFALARESDYDFRRPAAPGDTMTRTLCQGVCCRYPATCFDITPGPLDYPVPASSHRTSL
jgi:hypothetical protein